MSNFKPGTEIHKGFWKAVDSLWTPLLQHLCRLLHIISFPQQVSTNGPRGYSTKPTN
ncbi:MAG: hypothetical protein Sylvanvirus8_26, partial [Sylvanvirus sp.]